MVALDAKNQLVSEGHDASSAASQYLLHKVMSLIGAYGRYKLDAVCSSDEAVRTAQAAFLLKLLKDHEGTEYGQAHQFGELKTVADFRSCHPLTRYDHYAPWMERIYKDPDAKCLLSKQPISRIGLTSGTSGNPAMLPVVPEQRLIFFTQGIACVFDTISIAFPAFQSSMQRTLKLFYTPLQRTTPSGLPIGPNSSAPGDSKKLLQLYTTPPACYDFGLSEPECLYLYTLFALKDRNLGCVESNFVSAAELFFRNMRADFPRLINDIRHGTLSGYDDGVGSDGGLSNPNSTTSGGKTAGVPTTSSSSSTLSSNDVKQQVAALLGGPDPKRSNELQAIWEASQGRPQALELWPKLHFVLAVATGSFAVYAEKVQSEYARGVPIYSPLYAATEGLLGVNLEGPQSSSYVLCPEVKITDD
jgi:hypothetical protein